MNIFVSSLGLSRRNLAHKGGLLSLPPRRYPFVIEHAIKFTRIRVLWVREARWVASIWLWIRHFVAVCTCRKMIRQIKFISSSLQWRIELNPV